jgi:hypothetical protein
MRAVVLEAITALEAFVHQIVFDSLKSRLDPLLTKWLEEKTRMDFDSRLSILTPVALGQPVDKQSDLWARYKRAKEIRNAVTHSGRKVSYAEARQVVDTVYDWLAYLGSTAEVDLALLDFKRQVESGAIIVPNERAAAKQVANFFAQTRAAATDLGPAWAGNLRPDVILRFGGNTVIVEVKIVKSQDLQSVINDGIHQVSRYLEVDPRYRAGLILLSRSRIPEAFPALTVHDEGRISIVLVSLALDTAA